MKIPLSVEASLDFANYRNLAVIGKLRRGYPKSHLDRFRSPFGKKDQNHPKQATASSRSASPS
jgi:hypothetical protein